MKPSKLKEFILSHRLFLERTCDKLQRLNREYSPEEIRGIVLTSVFESKDLDERGIYLKSLNRILEEKGFVYQRNSLFKPTIRPKDNDDLVMDIASFQHYNMNQNEGSETSLIDYLLGNSKLTQVEVFVTALTFGLSTPHNLRGKYKKVLDNIEDVYYNRVLKKKEIAKIVGVSVGRIDEIKTSAYTKLEKSRSALDRLHRSRESKRRPVVPYRKRNRK